MIIKKQLLCLGLILLAGCAAETEQESVNYVLPYQEDVIALENLKTRVVAYCYSSPSATAQACAERFERRGFVRLEEIPRLTAEYDFLKEGTYPTRRWRNGEKVSRW
jgi:hypothetical protein